MRYYELLNLIKFNGVDITIERTWSRFNRIINLNKKICVRQYCFSAFCVVFWTRFKFKQRCKGPSTNYVTTRTFRWSYSQHYTSKHSVDKPIMIPSPKESRATGVRGAAGSAAPELGPTCQPLHAQTAGVCRTVASGTGSSESATHQQILKVDIF